MDERRGSGEELDRAHPTAPGELPEMARGHRALPWDGVGDPEDPTDPACPVEYYVWTGDRLIPATPEQVMGFREREAQQRLAYWRRQRERARQREAREQRGLARWLRRVLGGWPRAAADGGAPADGGDGARHGTFHDTPSPVRRDGALPTNTTPAPPADAGERGRRSSDV